MLQGEEIVDDIRILTIKYNCCQENAIEKVNTNDGFNYRFEIINQ
jgi:hypothetical protein